MIFFKERLNKSSFEGFYLLMFTIFIVCAGIRFIYWAFLLDIPPEYGAIRIIELYVLGTIADFFELLVLFFIVSFFMYITKKEKCGRAIIVFITVIFLIFHIADLEAYRQFLTHISVHDLLLVYDVKAWSSIITSQYSLVILFLFILIAVAIYIRSSIKKIQILKSRYGFTMIISFYIAIMIIGSFWCAHYLTVKEKNYRIGYDLASNFILYNIRNLVQHKSSKEVWTENDIKRVKDYISANAMNTSALINKGVMNKNDKSILKIILVIMESWSSADSMLFKGYQELLPKLGSIAQEGKYYTNFHANSATSGYTLLAIMSGLLPCMERNKLLLRDFPLLDYPSMPQELEKLGFNTIYLHNGSLLFEKQKTYLKKIGYDLILDRSDFDKEADIYGWGPSDMELFRKAIKLLENNKKQKQFLALASVTNHLPFELPDERYKFYKEPYKNTTLYSDAAFFWFYRKLKEEGILDQTLLIVMGDHVRYNRADMIDGKYKDYESRIPLVIWDPLGRLQKGEDTRLANQIDIFPTIMDYLKIESEYLFLGGSLLLPERVSKTVITRDYNRKIIIRKDMKRVDLFYDKTKKVYEVREAGNYILIPKLKTKDECLFEIEKFIDSYNRILLNNKIKHVVSEGLNKSLTAKGNGFRYEKTKTKRQED